MIALTKPQISLAAVLLINKLVFCEPKLDKNICINYAVKSLLIERFQDSKKGKDKNRKKRAGGGRDQSGYIDFCAPCSEINKKQIASS